MKVRRSSASAADLLHAAELHDKNYRKLRQPERVGHGTNRHVSEQEKQDAATLRREAAARG